MNPEIVAAVIFAVSGNPGPTPSTGISLETLLAAPLYSSFVAAPEGDRFAWVENRRGVRNVWVSSEDNSPAVPVTTFDQDDGQVISGLTLSRAATALAFARGGPAGPDGLAPDPLSTPGGGRLEVWVWRKGGAALRYGEGHSPRISPDGGTVAFVRNGKLLIGPASDPSKAVAAVEVRGRAGTLRWSPDGARLAFVSDRKDHSIVGVYDLESKAVTWMAPGFGVDGAPTWSPNGQRIAFLRVPPAPAARRSFEVEPQGPFGIWVADAVSGKGTPVFSSGEGKPHEVFEPEDLPLLWAGGDVLVFPWERDGWVRLYAVPVAGGAATPLSPANCEVRTARLAADRARLVFGANCDDLDRSHLWITEIRGGAPRALTRGAGIESNPAPGAHRVVFLSSSTAVPGVPALLDLDSAKTPRPLLPDALRGFPGNQLVEPEPVVLRAADGVETHAQLFRRPDLLGRAPAVVFVHGGPRRQMLLGWHPIGYYHRAYAMNQHLASWGYIVLSVNYRGGIGYGREFRLRAGRTPSTAFEDALAAAKYLRDRPDVEPTRIAIWGGSHGGYLSALALARNSDLFAAGVDIAGNTPTSMNLSRWRSPILIVHGDHDPSVPFSHSLELVRRLGAMKEPPEIETLMIPDEQHVYLRFPTWLRVLNATSDFLDRRIGEQRPEMASTTQQ